MMGVTAEDRDHKHWNGKVLASSPVSIEEDKVGSKEVAEKENCRKGCCDDKEEQVPVYAPLPPISELDIWHASQRGAVLRVAELINSGVVTANDRGEGNVTALHWAAINNHVEVANFLLDKGAEVDALGGDLVATPLHWAARAGHVQMVTLLYKKGANITLMDAQGYNPLHLAVHAGHLMMIIYLISIGLEIDGRDSMSRTPLMWSAYQGTSIEGMQEILRNGANVDLADSTGYTALHWAVISQHYEFAKLLIKEGANVNIKDPAGKTPQDWAKERETETTYLNLLKESKKGENRVGQNPLTNDATNRILTSISFVMIPFSFWVFSHVAIYLAVPIVVGCLYLIQKYLVIDYLFAKDGSQITASPITSSICQATLFYVFLSWYHILPYTSYMFVTHILFLGSFSMCAYSLYTCNTIGPGFIPQASSFEDKNKTVKLLADEGQLNARSYCPTCQIRKPLRSKHCKFCDRCVAVFDHHCPWTNGCIGVNNHRPFMFFCIFLDIGAWSFVYLSVNYLSEVFVADATYSQIDPWIFITAVWAFIQSVWVLFVVGSQLSQIAVSTTTNEAINYHRFDYLTHPDDVDAPAYRKRYLNRFDLGPIANCVNFWSQGAGELKDISWFEIYEIPYTLEQKALNRNKGYGSVPSKESSSSPNSIPMEKLV